MNKGTRGGRGILVKKELTGPTVGKILSYLGFSSDGLFLPSAVTVLTPVFSLICYLWIIYERNG